MKLLTEQRLRKLADELIETAERIKEIRSKVWRSYDSRFASSDLDFAARSCKSAANYMCGIRPPTTPKLRRMQAKEARSGNG